MTRRIPTGRTMATRPPCGTWLDVAAGRPAPPWEFKQDGQTYTAVALSLAPAPIVGG